MPQISPPRFWKWQGLQAHADDRLRGLWNLTQLAGLLLPLSGLLGAVGLLAVTIALWKRRFTAIVQRPLNQGFAIVAGLMLLSTLTAARPAEAAIGLVNFLPFFAVFAGLRELIQTPAQVRRLAWLLVIGSVPVGAIGLGQQFLGWAGEVRLLWIVVDWNLYPTGNPPGRMASVFFYATVLASYLVITLPLAIGLWLDGNPLHSRQGRLRQGFLTIAVLGNAIALVFTNSRNAWAIALLAGLAFAIYLGWRWLGTIVVAIAAVLTGAAFAPTPLRDSLRLVVPSFFWARLTDELYPDRPLAQLRSTQWQFAAHLVQQRPWTGWGLRNFTPLYQEKMQIVLGHPHNLPLMLACETGLPTTLLFYGLVGAIVVRGLWTLRFWRSFPPETAALTGFTPQNQQILFTVLVAFLSSTLFSLLDVTLFDVRLNLLGWLLLAAIAGVSDRANAR